MRMLTMAAVLAAAGTACADTITGLGVPAGWTVTWATGMSSSGAVVVGSALDAQGRYHAWRWTAAGGMVELVPLSAGALSWALGVSADGTVAVGESRNAAGQSRPVRWTPGGVQDLVGLPGAMSSAALSANANGTIVVGESGGSFRWIALQGVQNFEALTGLNAVAVSPDGAVYAGMSGFRAMVWSQTSGLMDLGVPLEENQFSAARLVGTEGRVVAGLREVVGLPLRVSDSFRWLAGEVRWLGMMDPEAMTPTGSIVVGRSSVPGKPPEPSMGVARLWTEPLGGVDLKQYLESRGMNLAEWRLDRAVGVSTDGRVLAGTGLRLIVGQWWQQAWRITLDAPIPTCYANCDLSTAAPVLNVADFSCFLNRFAAGDARANCDGSSVAPVLNVADFVCFLNRFAEGCE